MEILEQRIKLIDSCQLIRKSKDIFAPIKETITNSLDAIYQRKKNNITFTPNVSLSVYFKSSKDLFNNEIHTLDFITVEDNGIGFTSDNLERLKKLAENSKNMNNRGTGKVQIFCRFNKLSIDSTFKESNKWYNLKSNWLITGEYEDILQEKSKQNDCKTTVKMSDFSGDKAEHNFFCKYFYSIDELKKDILKRFLLRLWQGITKEKLIFTINIFANSNLQGEYTFNEDNIPKPDKEKILIIKTEQAKIISERNNKTKIEWYYTDNDNELSINHFKLSSADMDSNGIYMCSKNIVVEPFKFSAIRKNANFNGFRYLTSISGVLFDDPIYINQAVDGFLFPSKKIVEAELINDSPSLFNPENKFIFWEEIKDKVNQGLSQVYSDIEGLKEERDKDIAALAKQYGISLEDAEESDVDFSDTEEEATEKLFKTQARRFAKQSIEIRKTYTELKELETKKLDPTSEQYRIKFNELSNKLLENIPKQNKDELVRYVIRRDMVVELLKLTLANELTIQKIWAEKKAKGEKIGNTDREGVVHDLIFKRRMKGVPNDLWILNEEFVHFKGCSNIELSKIEIDGEKLLRSDVDIDAAIKAVGIETGSSSVLKWKPDIFLYPEEGKCVLIEIKAPDEELSKYCDQMQKYAKIIANYSKLKFTYFFGFLIGEQLTELAMPDRYKKVPYGNYWVYPNEPINDISNGLHIADIYQEVIQLSEISKRAEIRNKSFAEKLGITQEDVINIKKMDGE